MDFDVTIATDHQGFALAGDHLLFPCRYLAPIFAREIRQFAYVMYLNVFSSSTDLTDVGPYPSLQIGVVRSRHLWRVVEPCCSTAFEWDAAELGNEWLPSIAFDDYRYTPSTSSLWTYRSRPIPRSYCSHTGSMFRGKSLKKGDFHNPA
jgi:hypothetical protein